MLTSPVDTPRTLGRYELLHPLASGGMATVFLGRAAGIAGFERLVAVKVCHPHLRNDAAFASMFLDEARLAARIHHPNVVSVLDVGDDGALFFVMEYIEGVALSELVRTVGPMPMPVGMRVALDLLAGLHAAHETRDSQGRLLNVVHRDVSPQNALVGCDGVTRVVDFGVAKAEARATVTKGGVIKGKIGYMPPEQFLGTPVERQADLYAAAVVIWETLSGVRLFEADTEAAVMNMVLRGKLRAWPEDVPPPPAALLAVLTRALSVDPAARFATAKEMANALCACGVASAASHEVGELVKGACSSWLAERRELVLTINTKRGEPSNRARKAWNKPSSWFDAGHVLVVPRKWIWGVGVLVAGLIFAAYSLRPGERQPLVGPAPPRRSPAEFAATQPVEAKGEHEVPEPSPPMKEPTKARTRPPEAKRIKPNAAPDIRRKLPQQKRGEFRPTDL